ncbi:MAG: substrate-binding domain-containing protein [Caldilineaceae bacterium]
MLNTLRFRFLLIVGSTVLLISILLILQQMKMMAPLVVNQVTLRLAVAPELADWVTDAARAFQNNTPGVVLQVQALPGLRALQQWPGSAPTALPHLWLPEARWLADAGQAQAFPYGRDGSSMAQTFLQWGAFQSRASVLGGLTWPTVRQAAQVRDWQTLGGTADWGRFKLVLASPAGSTQGLAALLAAAAAYHEQARLTETMVTDPAFLGDLQRILACVPGFTTLGPTPAAVLATRGSASGDVGLLTSAEWQQFSEQLNRVEPFVTQTPTLTIAFDYPLLVRQALSSSEQQVAAAFREFLLAQAARQPLPGFSQPAPGATFIEPEPVAILALLRWAENADLER